MPLTPKEMVKLLLHNGFVKIKSNNGSHCKFYNEKTNVVVIVPMHAKDLKKGLEQAILKNAGIRKEQ